MIISPAFSKSPTFEKKKELTATEKGELALDNKIKFLVGRLHIHKEKYAKQEYCKTIMGLLKDRTFKYCYDNSSASHTHADLNNALNYHILSILESDAPPLKTVKEIKSLYKTEPKKLIQTAGIYFDRTEPNNNSLPDDRLQEMYKLKFKSGLSNKYLGEQYGISTQTARINVMKKYLKEQRENGITSYELRDYIDGFKKHFNLPENSDEQVLKILISNPIILNKDYKELSKKPEELCSLLGNRIPKEDLLNKIYFEYPVYFTIPAHTVYKNMHETADFIEKISKQDKKTVYECMMARPMSIGSPYETHRNKFNLIADDFKNDGITIEHLLQKKDNIAFFLSNNRETFNKKLNTLVNLLEPEQIDRAAIIDYIFNKQIKIMNGTPENIACRLKLRKEFLADEFRDFSPSNDELNQKLFSKNLIISNERAKSQYLRYKMFEGKKVQGFPIEKVKSPYDIIVFLRTNPETEYNMEFLDNESCRSLAEFAKEISEKALGKNVFNITFIRNS